MSELTLKYFNRVSRQREKYNEIYFEQRDHKKTMEILLGGMN